MCFLLFKIMGCIMHNYEKIPAVFREDGYLSNLVCTRDNNIEALRIVAMFLIIFFHLALNGEIPMSSRGGSGRDFL